MLLIRSRPDPRVMDERFYPVFVDDNDDLNLPGSSPG
jgi:hypothetical protein